jgi:hypothetical protein
MAASLQLVMKGVPFCHLQFNLWWHTDYLSSDHYARKIAVRVMLSVLKERRYADGAQGPSGRSGLLGRILALRSSRAFDTARVITAVKTGPNGRKFRTPSSEGLVGGSASSSKDREEVLYSCNFVQFEQHVERAKALSTTIEEPCFIQEIEPLDRVLFERDFGSASALDGSFQKESQMDPNGNAVEGERQVPWDRAFWTLVMGDQRMYMDNSGNFNVLWASLIANREHGPQFAVELLDALAQQEASRHSLKMTLHAYVIIEHQVRTDSQWAERANRAGLCWAMVGGVWERVLGLLGRAEPDKTIVMGDLLRDGCSLLSAFFECTPRTTCYQHVPKRVKGGLPEPGKDPPEKVWYAQQVCPDLVTVYRAYERVLDGTNPDAGIPCPEGGYFHAGPKRGARKDVRAKARRALMWAQWLHAESGGGGWFPGSDKLLLTHDAAAEGDVEVRLSLLSCGRRCLSA